MGGWRCGCALLALAACIGAGRIGVAAPAADGAPGDAQAAKVEVAEASPWHWTPELAVQIRSVRNVQPSPDGRWISYEVAEPIIDETTSEYRTHIHVAETKEGGRSFQLTRGDDSCSGAQWSPDGEWIAFRSSRGEAKEGEAAATNLYRISIHGGEAERLTEEATSVGRFLWSPTGEFIAFVSEDPETEEEKQLAKEKRSVWIVDRGLKAKRLRIVPVEADEGGERPVRTATPDSFSVSGIYGTPTFDIAPDGKRIVFGRNAAPTIDDWPAVDLAEVDLVTGTIRDVLTSGAAESDPFYSRDGNRIAFLRTDDPATWAITMRVCVLDLESGTMTELAKTFDERPDILRWSADDASVIVAESRGTLERVYALPADGGKATMLNERDDVLLGGAHLDSSGRFLGFAAESMTSPPEAGWAPVDELDDQLTILSDAQPDVSDLPLPRTEVITWTSPDGTEIEGLLTYPLGWDELAHGTAGDAIEGADDAAAQDAGRNVGRPAKAPLLVIVHGGPAGAFQQRFIARRGAYPIAAFAERGYFVLRPNPRGSSAYGRAFRYANVQDWGDGPLADITSGVDHLIDEGMVDPSRIGLMGWSYGGYMTAYAITQTDRFAAASVGAGVTNLLSMTGVTDIPSFMVSYFEGEYWQQLDVWRRNSPMEYAGNVTTPTLIQHGEEDARVPVSQAKELYAALKRMGAPAQLVIYPRQGHGVGEPKLQIDAMQRNLDWFEHWILKGGESE